MQGKLRIFQYGNTQGYPLRDHIDLHHRLVELADMIGWAALDRVATEPLSRAFRFRGPVSSPDCFTGSMRSVSPMNRSSPAGWKTLTGRCSPARRICKPSHPLTRQVCRAGASGQAGQGDQAVEYAAGTVDTTVVEKAIAYPADSALLERGREHLVKAARHSSLHLRQNYSRQAPRLVQLIGRYAHAKQFRRMRAPLRTQRSRVE